MVRWNITEKNLARLDRIPHIEAGTLALACRDIESAGFNRVVRFVQEQGTLLHSFSLRLAQRPSQRADLTQVDFATACPHLHTLDLKTVRVNASLFTHPALAILKLWEATYQGPRAISLGADASEHDGHPLREVSMMDCLLPVDTLTVGPAAHLKLFQYYLDEDFSAPDVAPDDFVFKTCPQLEAITIHACQVWQILISGVLPRLARISLDATQYCSYQCKLEDIDDHQRAKYSRLLEQAAE